MNAERLLEHFHRIGDAPDAIPRLRQFILDLAVRGELVEQDPNDEPASELLKRIAAEKARLVKAGEIGKRNELPALKEDEVPFPVPSTWLWLLLGELGFTQTGTTPSKNQADYFGKHIPFIKPGDIYSSYVDYSNEGLSVAGIGASGRDARPGSILMVCIGTIGKCQLIDRDCSFNQQINSLSPHGETDSRYLLAACQSDYFQQAAWAASARTTIAILNKGNWELLPLPLPPLAEQRRIVAKVDELMVLCDRLEAAWAGREAVRDRLAAASLARLNAPDPATFQDDTRFALDTLQALTTRPDQIKPLRQTILNLAVRGKLVPQDPNDEPASELLKRIRKWNLDAIRRKQIRAPRKPLKPINQNENPYLRPNGWEWARLGEIIYIQSGDGLTAANMQNGEVPVFGGNGINGYHDIGNVDQQTIVIGRVGYYCGSIHVTPLKAWVTDNAFITHFCQDDIYLKFLVLLLKGTNLKEDENATAQPVISGSKIYSIVVGLPPLAEQRRIVTKVDALIALCDRLEARLDATAATRRRLLDALLADALAPAATRKREAAE